MTNNSTTLEEILHDVYLAGWNDKLCDANLTYIPSEQPAKNEALARIEALLLKEMLPTKLEDGGSRYFSDTDHGYIAATAWNEALDKREKELRTALSKLIRNG